MSSIEDKRRLSVNELESPATEVAVEMPARNLYVKCPACRRVIEQQAMAENLDVCPRCGHHLRVSGRARMRMTVDEGSFQEWDAELAPTDFLEFPGYADKLAAAQEATHERDAVVSGRATIGGHACATFFMDAEFMMGSMGSVVGEKVSRCFERALEEGLPVVGMEAQASGLPCVFSTGVTEEVLLRPDSCRISLEQPDEAWAAVLKDADRNLPDRAQAAAQVRAAGYDIRQETLRLQQLYTGLIAKRSVAHA